MFEKSPPEDTLYVFADQEIEFRINYGSYRIFRVEVQENDSTVWNTSTGTDSFVYSNGYSAGEHHLTIGLYDSGITSEKEPENVIELGEGGAAFSWEIKSINPGVLYDTEFERAIKIVEKILMLMSIGQIGLKAKDYIEDYYESLPKDEQEKIEKQTQIKDFLDD